MSSMRNKLYTYLRNFNHVDKSDFSIDNERLGIPTYLEHIEMMYIMKLIKDDISKESKK